MELVFRHFWIAFVIVTFVNLRTRWSQVQRRIRSQPDLEQGYRRLYYGYMCLANLPWLAMGFGCLSGAVPSVIDYLRPSEGNSFVLAWWGLMGAALVFSTYWMLFGGGAEMLERHPGFFMVPEWTASKLRMFWLGTVASSIAMGALVFLDFPKLLTQRGEMPFQNTWLWALFPVIFVAMWLLSTFLISELGGWGRLAVSYASKSSFSGKRFYFRSAQFGGYVGYGSCLTLGSGPNGFYLAVIPLFRLGHPPLLIPWSDITACEVRRWLVAGIELQFAKTPWVSVRLSRRLAQSLFDASGIQVPVQPEA